MTKNELDAHNKIKIINLENIRQETDIGLHQLNHKNQEIITKYKEATEEIDTVKKSKILSMINDLENDKIFIINQLNKSKDNYRKALENEGLFSEEVIKTTDLNNNSKVNKDIIDNGDDIIRSSFFNDILERFDSLELVQKIACCFFISGNLILSSVITIIFSLYGEYLLNRFKLEEKYPKLAHIINLRRKLQSYYLKLNLFWLVLVGTSHILFAISIFF